MILSRFGLEISFRRLVAPVILFASVCSLFATDPVVSNVQAKQREGSRLVDITYDVADPDSPTLTVYLKVSADGGKTWKGPVELVSGDVGQHIVPGNSKRLIWDAGKEMPNQFGTKFRYKIWVSDQWIPPKDMAFIPAGLFQKGDSRTFGPSYSVYVSAFSIDKNEVTGELWETVKVWGNKNGYDLVTGQAYGKNHPVHSVNWYEVVKWCNARSEMNNITPAYYVDVGVKQIYKTGKITPEGIKWDAGYRLPTEAEWEKAARGGVEGKLYPWGTDTITISDANYLDSQKDVTVPVASYSPNGYGVYDMAGNIYEWCWDWYGGARGGIQTDPRGPNTGTIRAVRGGAWMYDSRGVTVSGLNGEFPKNPVHFIGFRSALPAGQP